jgi:hypothetical protein
MFLVQGTGYETVRKVFSASMICQWHGPPVI